MYTDAECPTCGSDDREFRHVGYIDLKDVWKYCSVCGDVSCPDSWHDIVKVAERNLKTIEFFKFGADYR